MPTLTKTKPEKQAAGDRCSVPPALADWLAKSLADERGELRRVIGFPGGQSSQIRREE